MKKKTKKQLAAHAAAQRRYYRKKKARTIRGELESIVTGMKTINPEVLEEIDRADYMEQLNKRSEALEKLKRIEESGRTPTLKELKNLGKATVTEYDENFTKYYEIKMMLADVGIDVISDKLSSGFGGSRGGRLLNSEAQRMVDNNEATITSILERAREKYTIDEIIEKLEKVFPGGDLQYEIERLIYGMYDKEYSAWGGRNFLSKLSELRAELA